MSRTPEKPAALFISYDGLTDPLGGSQIVPYLLGISKLVRLHVVSLEKPGRFQADGASVRELLGCHGIQWHSASFSWGRQPWLKAWDLLKIHLLGLQVGWRYKVSVVHCRSYIPAQVGLALKKLTGVPLLFDMRGLWVNERVDGGLWNLKTFRGRSLFYIYKKVEKWLLKGADQLVTLTEASLPVLREWCGPSMPPTTVIPCCADFQHFSIDPSMRLQIRQQLGIESDAFVLCYLGSLGTWYRLPEMLTTFDSVRSLRPGARFLVITRDWNESHDRLLEEMGLSHLRPDILTIGLSRGQIPDYLQAADVGLSYITPSFSKVASCPTKLAEYFASGLPVICNGGVGDVKEYVQSLQAGIVREGLEHTGVSEAELERLESISRQELRARATEVFSLERAARSYASIYARILVDRSQS